MMLATSRSRDRGNLASNVHGDCFGQRVTTRPDARTGHLRGANSAVAAATAATVLQLVHRNERMGREGSRRLGNRWEPAVVHVSVSLDNVGSDNLAWCVEIASDRSPNDRTAHENVLDKVFRSRRRSICRSAGRADVRGWAYRSKHGV